MKKLAVLTAVLLLAVPIHSIAEETTVTETFDNQEINTDITFVYGASDTELTAATSQSPDCTSTEEAGLIGIEDMDCFQSVYFGNDRYQLGIRGSSDNLTIAFPNEPYEVGFNYAAIDQGPVSGTVYYDNGASETFTLDNNTDIEVAGSKVFAVAEGVETFITEIVIEGITDWWLIDNVYYKYDVPNNTPPSTTTTSTTLPKAEDVVEDNITTYLAWDENGCEHPDNPLSYKQYLEAIESGDWFGYQPGDCTNIPDVVVEIIEEEIDDELDEDILADDTLTEEDILIEEEVIELTEEEIAAIEAEIAAEEERLIQEQIDAEEELLILEELEDSTIDLENLSEEELEEFVDIIQELEDTIEIIEIEEEVIELDIPEEVIIIIEEEVLEDDVVIVVEDEEVIEEVLDESIQEDAEEEPAEELSEEEVIVEVSEVEEIVEDIVVEEATTEEVVEVLEEVNDVGVQNLDKATEEVQEIVQAVVEEAIENVEELTEEQVEVVAEVLSVETEDVEIIAEAVKSDTVVAEAVEEYVERAVENADVEDYTLADVVTEIQYEAFIENPIEVFVDINVEEINLTTIGDDMTTDQKEKAQEVVVPVILTRIATMAAFVFRKTL
mgnify:CR=1 FL=1